MPSKVKKTKKRAVKKAVMKRTKPVKNGFPDRMTVGHRYVENASITCTSGAFNNIIFSANGLYDPRLAAGGHQPMNFDTMTLVYKTYTVIGSKITVKFVDADSTVDAIPCFAGIVVDNDTSYITDYTTLMEQKKGKFALLPSNSTQGVYTLTNKWSAKKSHGGKDIVGNDDLRGNLGAAPVDQYYYQIWCNPASGSGTTVKNVLIVIEYIAVWTDVITQAGS